MTEKKTEHSRARRPRFARRSPPFKTRPRTFGHLRPEIDAESHGFEWESVAEVTKRKDRRKQPSVKSTEGRIANCETERKVFSFLPSLSRLTLLPLRPPAARFLTFRDKRPGDHVRVESNSEVRPRGSFALPRPRSFDVCFLLLSSSSSSFSFSSPD